MFWSIAAMAVSVLALFVAARFYIQVKALPTAGTEVERVGALIRRGAFTFLKREYRSLSVFCAVAGTAILVVVAVAITALAVCPPLSKPRSLMPIF